MKRGRAAELIESLLVALRRERTLSPLNPQEGSQALRSQNLLFAVEQRHEFERFALFFHYLQDTLGADLPSRLTEAASVLKELRDGSVDDEVKRGRAAELIESLLVALRRERTLSPLNPPRVFHYG